MTAVRTSEPVVRADRLLTDRPAEPLRAHTAGTRIGRRAVTAMLRRMGRDRLDVVEDGSRTTFGDPHGQLSALVEIRDPRAWSSVATEGSIGLGRGFIEGWWTSDDPVTVVRVLIRNLGVLDDVRVALARLGGPVRDRARRLISRRSPHRDKEDIASHYDIGNEFFALFLDETMTYSSAVFESPDIDLRAASEAKHDRLLDKLGVDGGHNLLEIGTGWGGFAIRTADRHGCAITTTTISDEQLSEARRRVHRLGLGGKVRLVNRDWRELTGEYDRVVSIEMIEAVDWRDFDRYFGTIERCLRPDGMVGLQAICVPDRRFDAAKTTEDFIRRFVFPGGNLPSIGAISRAVATTHLRILDVEDLTSHYAETLRRWRTRFDDRLSEVMALGLDDRFCRLWRFYLSYCEAGFRERHVTLNQLVLVGPDWRSDQLEHRPH